MDPDHARRGSFRNFAIGTTYSKTETVQTAICGILIPAIRSAPAPRRPS